MDIDLGIDSEPSGLQTLANPECAALLASSDVGRLAYASDEGIDIVPVNYALDHDDVVLRVQGNGRVARFAVAQRVAFEVDQVDPVARSGWSVLVRGRAVAVADAGELDRLRGLPLRPWPPGNHHAYIRITAEAVTGRLVEAGGELTVLWLG